MQSTPERVLVDGQVGVIETFVDPPAQSPRGIVVVTHPQPLLGGSAQHEIPLLLARALRDAGWLAVRPNFRGVGGSAGVHDRGIGESADISTLVTRLRADHRGLPLALVGYSFGAFVQARVARDLADRGDPAWRVALAGMPCGEVEGQRRYETPSNLPDALVVHGELDDRVPLAAVLAWAHPQPLQAISVVPGADHFFTGRLPLLRSLVLSHLTLVG